MRSGKVVASIKNAKTIEEAYKLASIKPEAKIALKNLLIIQNDWNSSKISFDKVQEAERIWEQSTQYAGDVSSYIKRHSSMEMFNKCFLENETFGEPFALIIAVNSVLQMNKCLFTFKGIRTTVELTNQNVLEIEFSPSEILVYLNQGKTKSRMVGYAECDRENQSEGFALAMDIVEVIQNKRNVDRMTGG